MGELGRHGEVGRQFTNSPIHQLERCARLLDEPVPCSVCTSAGALTPRARHRYHRRVVNDARGACSERIAMTLAFTRWSRMAGLLVALAIVVTAPVVKGA